MSKNNLKKAIRISVIFLIALVPAFYFENQYRILVRYLFRWFTSDAIVFFGKDFHLFVEPGFVISFGIFSAIFINSILKDTGRQIIGKISIVILLFFLATLLSSYLDSKLKVIECTECVGGIRKLDYNAIKYHWHFMLSLGIAIIPTIITEIKRRKKISKDVSI